jgi:GINS complex subunit 1
MEISKPSRLLKELKISNFIPFYNTELTEDLLKDYNKMCEIVEKNKKILLEEKNLELTEKSKTVYLLTLTFAINRIFRVMLAYINNRLIRIKDKFWESGGDNPLLNEFLSENEKDFYIDYKELVSKYQDSFPVQLNLLTDLEPPKDLFIEIRVLENIGEIVNKNGEVLNLQKNSTLLVRRCDVENLLKQGKIVQTR